MHFGLVTAGLLAALSPAFLTALRTNGLDAAPDPVSTRLLAEYGSVFVGAKAVRRPPRVMLGSSYEVLRFQLAADLVSLHLGSVPIRLQRRAAEALRHAVAEAGRRGLRITPRGGPSAACRSYNAARTFWNRRVDSGLRRWRTVLDPARARTIRTGPLLEQVAAILAEESAGHFFSTAKDKSILESVAPPGGSQHHWGLALDIEQFSNPAVRAILAAHGWFQTVISDLPHFTYLGLPATALPGRGLERVRTGHQEFWIPSQ